VAMSFFGSSAASPAAPAPAVRGPRPEDRGPPARSPSAKPQTGATPADYPKENTCGICCMFFLFLWITPISVVFFYHAAPTTVIALFIVWNLFALSPWVFHAGGVIGSDISGPLLTLSLFASVSLSFLHGVRCYYHHSQPMRQLALSREYQGVYPDLPGMAFPDAAYVEFVGNATIDFTKAMSYQSLDSGLSTFCVAPIVSKASVGRHDFWAIGVDCCKPGGKTKADFWCYDAGEPDVKTGWVLPTQFGDALYSTLGRYVSPAESRRDLFVEAVQKAESVHGIVSPGEKAIFLRWTKTKKEDILFYEFIGVVVTVVISGAILAVMSFGMTRLYQRFTHIRVLYDRSIAEQGGVAEDDYDRQFFADAVEGAGGELTDRIQSFQGMSVAQLAAKHHKPPDPKDMCLMTIVIPYIVLMLCVVLCTFSPCYRLGHLVMAPFWCINLIFVLALLATPGRVVNGLFILLCCTAGYYIGITNYKQNMFHFCSSSDRRLYKEVPAAASTADYWDAGSLQFEASTMLSTYHSVGFLYQGTTYCAAPVIARTAVCKNGLFAGQGQAGSHIAAPVGVTSLWQAEVNHVMALATMEKARFDTFQEFADSEDHHVAPPSFMQQRRARHHSLGGHRHHSRTAASVPASEVAAGGCHQPAPTQIEFWAIGVDCCDARKRFWCDGGDKENAKEAVVMRAFGNEDNTDHSDGPAIRSDRGHFFQAIDQAVAAYDLPVPDRPVLLRWGPSAKDLQADWRRHAVGIIGLTALAALIAILVIGVISYFFLRHLQRQSLKDMEEYEGRTGAPAGDYSAQSPAPSPRPSLPAATQGGEDGMRF